MSENAFKENKEYLIAAKEEVRKRDDIAKNIENLKNQQKKLARSIASEEKSIAEEISQTIKKRKQEIEDSYDKRIDDNRARKRKVLNKRDKKKAERVSKRIDNETKHIRQNTKDLEVELRTLFKKERVPRFCNSHLYYIMFSPKGMEELLLMVLSFLVYFAGIPGAATFLIRKLVLEKKENINMAFWCVLIAAVMVILLLVIYFVIFNATKNGHRGAIEQGRSIWDKIKANKRQAAVIRNSINKDKDESQYKLGAFDDQLDELDQEADAIGEEKQSALKDFEINTTDHIRDEINSRRLPKLKAMKEEKKSIEEAISSNESMYSDQAMLVTRDYAPYLGEDLCKYEKILDLIGIIEDGQAKTVSEAINLYKGGRSR